MSEKSSSSSGEITASSLLGIVFITLKILAIEPVASWSWWWVLCPFWIGLAIVFGFLAVALAGALLVALFKK